MTIDIDEPAPVLDVPVEPRSPGEANPTSTRQGWGLVAWLCAGWLLMLGLAASLAPWLPIQDPLASDFDAIAQGPSLDHPLGTDANGRDLLSRIVFGARVSLTVGVGSTLIAVAIGTLIGMVAAYFGGLLDRTLRVLLDAMLAFPALVLALVVTTYLGSTVVNLTLVIGAIAIPAYARISRAATLSIAEREFVRASQAAGLRSSRIMAVDLLPNVALPVTAFALIGASTAVVVEASLGFLGLGIQPPQPSWGTIISAGRTSLQEAPHIVFIPSMVLLLTVLALSLLGDRVRERTDVRESTL